MKKKENPERRVEVEKTLLELSGMEQKALFEKYQTDEYGLDPVQAADRLEEYGRNIIDFGKEKNLAVRIKDAVIIISATISFVQEEKSNNAAKKLQGMISTTLAVIAVTLIIGFTGVSALFDLPTMPISYMLWLAILMVVYMIFAQIMKVIYIKRHKDWY